MWLVRMSAHALADSGAGETPLIPLALLEEAERAGGGPGAKAIHALCEALLEVGLERSICVSLHSAFLTTGHFLISKHDSPIESHPCISIRRRSLPWCCSRLPVPPSAPA